jgi:hypothetical protein
MNDSADASATRASGEVPLFDEDGALSREYLVRRGNCCRNGCKNCPYGFHQIQLESGPNHDQELHSR